MKTVYYDAKPYKSLVRFYSGTEKEFVDALNKKLEPEDRRVVEHTRGRTIEFTGEGKNAGMHFIHLFIDPVAQKGETKEELIGVIAHECHHAAAFLADFIGLKDDGEAVAYLFEDMFMAACKFFVPLRSLPKR